MSYLFIHFPLVISIPMPTLLVEEQSRISNQKLGLVSNQWCAYLAQFNPDPTKHSLTLRWLTTFLHQLWNTAWDLWWYCNDIVHNNQESTIMDKLKMDI